MAVLIRIILNTTEIRLMEINLLKDHSRATLHFSLGPYINYVDQQGEEFQRYFLTKGEGGVKIHQNFVNVVYECPLCKWLVCLVKLVSRVSFKVRFS